jgi:hypothetical protein
LAIDVVHLSHMDQPRPDTITHQRLASIFAFHVSCLHCVFLHSTSLDHNQYHKSKAYELRYMPWPYTTTNKSSELGISFRSDGCRTEGLGRWRRSRDVLGEDKSCEPATYTIDTSSGIAGVLEGMMACWNTRGTQGMSSAWLFTTYCRPADISLHDRRDIQRRGQQGRNKARCHMLGPPRVFTSDRYRRCWIPPVLCHRFPSTYPLDSRWPTASCSTSATMLSIPEHSVGRWMAWSYPL